MAIPVDVNNFIVPNQHAPAVLIPARFAGRLIEPIPNRPKKESLTYKIVINTIATIGAVILLAVAPTVLLLWGTSRLCTLAISVCGKKGNKLSHHINRKINRLFYTIFDLNNRWISPKLSEDSQLVRLTKAKNIITKSDYIKLNDRQHANELNQQIEEYESLLPEEIRERYSEDLLAEVNQFRFAHSKLSEPISYGSCMHTIKSLIKRRCRTEAELVDHVNQFKNGFSAEAMLMSQVSTQGNTSQKVMESIILPRRSLRFNPNRQELIDRYNEILRTAIPYPHGGIFDARIRKLILITFNEFRSNVFGLKIKFNENRPEKIHFSDFTINDQIRNNFNHIVNGYYEIRIHRPNIPSVYEHIVYIKKNFGSYIFDPRFGLFRCDPANPANDLQELLSKEYPSQRHDLEIFSYKLL